MTNPAPLHKQCSRSFALAVVLWALAFPAVAETESPVWRITLGQQLLGERRCKLDKILYVRRRGVSGEAVLEGRARCGDGREFDFTRPYQHGKFKLRLCLPTVC